MKITSSYPSSDTCQWFLFNIYNINLYSLISHANDQKHHLSAAICWNLTREKYAPAPPRVSSSEWVPSSKTHSPPITDILAAFWTVESRWATTTQVLPTIVLLSALWTSLSDSLSGALVALSSCSIAGSLTLLMQGIFCACPPEICTPLSPL